VIQQSHVQNPVVVQGLELGAKKFQTGVRKLSLLGWDELLSGRFPIPLGLYMANLEGENGYT